MGGAEAGRGLGALALALAGRSSAGGRTSPAPCASLGADWAPGGDWARASEGDPETWTGYELQATEVRGKVGDPGRCSPPDDEPFAVAAEFNAATAKDPRADEAVVLEQIAERRASSVSEITRQVMAVEMWCGC